MSQQEKKLTQNPFGEGLQGELLTAECSRQEFLKPDAYLDLADAPSLIIDTLRYLAGNSLVKGVAILAEQKGNGFLFRAFKESLADETDSSRAEDAVRATILAVSNGAMESLYMEGGSFEASEKQIRDYVSGTPEIMLLGIIKFTE